MLHYVVLRGTALKMLKTPSNAFAPMQKNTNTTPMLNHAINNNAVWCNTVCKAHGAPGEFCADFWVNRHPVPTFYSNLIRRAQRENTKDLFDMIQTLLESDIPKPWSIKDSFQNLDLRNLGFRKLFDASWITLPAHRNSPPPVEPNIHWSVVEDEAELIQWEQAWKGHDANTTPSTEPRLWVPEILHNPHVTFLAGRIHDEIVAVGVTNQTGDVVGLSNVFARIDTNGDHWAGVIAKTTELFPGLAIVGYERGKNLASTQQLGFEVIGSLGVWIVE